MHSIPPQSKQLRKIPIANDWVTMVQISVMQKNDWVISAIAFLYKITFYLKSTSTILFEAWSAYFFFSELYISKPTFVRSNKQEARRQVRLPQKARLTTYLSIQNTKPTVKYRSFLLKVPRYRSLFPTTPPIRGWHLDQITKSFVEVLSKPRKIIF